MIRKNEKSKAGVRRRGGETGVGYLQVLCWRRVAGAERTVGRPAVAGGGQEAGGALQRRTSCHLRYYVEWDRCQLRYYVRGTLIGVTGDCTREKQTERWKNERIA